MRCYGCATENERQKFADRGEYDTKAYHTNPNYIATNARNSAKLKDGTLIDTYTGESFHPSNKNDEQRKPNLDHTVAAINVHDDAGRVLAELDGPTLANMDVNLNPTNASVNKSKKAKTCLLDHIVSNPKQLLFFTLDDLVQGKRPDGTTAYIDALHQGMGEEFVELFGSIPDSASTPYTLDKVELAIDLPSSKDLPFLRGKTGKEREVVVPLDDFDWELILFLGWCARGFSLRDVSDNVLVLGGGWVKLLKEEDVKVAKEMASKLAKMALPLLQFSGDALRLASKPEYTYFSDRLYSYAYAPSNNEGGQINLYLKEQTTRFAILIGQQQRFRVPRNIANVIETIQAGKNTSNIPAIKNAEKSIQKQNLDTVTNEVTRLGLRRLIKMSNNAEMSIVAALYPSRSD